MLTPDDVRGFPRIAEITMNGEPISVTNLYLPGEFLPSLTDWEVLQAIGKPTHEFAKGLRLGRYLQEHSWLNRYAKPYLPVEVDQCLRFALQCEVGARTAVRYPILEGDMYRWVAYGHRNGFRKVFGMELPDRYPEFWEACLGWAKDKHLYFRFPTGEIIAALPPNRGFVVKWAEVGEEPQEGLPSEMYERSLCLGTAMFMGKAAKHKMTLDDHISIAKSARHSRATSGGLGPGDSSRREFTPAGGRRMNLAGEPRRR